MGNLRQKFTDEEWEDILKNGYSSTERLTPKEIKEKYGLDINEPVKTRCVEMSDKDISEITHINHKAETVNTDLSDEGEVTPGTYLALALLNNKDYYEVWRANIAMAFVDEYYSETERQDHERLEGFEPILDLSEIANNAAERFLKQLMS